MLGEPEQALKLIAQLQAGVSEPKIDLYKAAEALCYFVGAAEKDTRVPEARRKQLARGYADQAMDLLRQAVKAGQNNVGDLKGDPDLDPLRGREDFKKLIAELEAKLKVGDSGPKGADAGPKQP
jgi:hypothetical protein